MMPRWRILPKPNGYSVPRVQSTHVRLVLEVYGPRPTRIESKAVAKR